MVARLARRAAGPPAVEPAPEAELILAEAEDHLRETAAAGLAIGMTEREAQEAAISSFGPVRAVVRAHHARRGWLPAAAEAGLAASTFPTTPPSPST
jgi:hypothetical protein